MIIKTFAIAKKDDNNTIVNPPVNANDAEVEYKDKRQFILYRMRHDVNGLDGTARMEGVRRELKMNHASAYPNMIELHV